ncbi:PAS domain S-box protein [Thermodesulfobacteriota bacterium]
MTNNEFLTVHDMSMEQLAERLEEIERNYEEFFAGARDGFYISTKEGQFLDCNDALVNMLAYRVTEEVLALDLNTDLWANPWDRVRFQAIIEQQGRVNDYRAVFKRKDGSPIHVTLSSEVWRDEQGSIKGYRGFVVDRTEERLMRLQLALSETKYRDLLNNIREGVFISDAAGTIIDCNQALCEITGFSIDESVGMNYYRDLFVDAADLPHFSRRFKGLGEVSDHELQIIRKDGTIRDVHMSGYATWNAAGGVSGYQGIMRDITEAKRLRVQLLQSEKLSAMGKMASQLAHELNNPVYAIMNCMELVKDALPATHEKKKYLEQAYNECKRTSGLLIKMLKFFRPDNEEKRPTNINKLLEETLLFYEKQFKNLNIRVVTDLANDLPMLPAVGSQLKQVFINMIINSNTAMSFGGELRVSSGFDPDENHIVVTIRDSGRGIPMRDLQRIFDAFFTTKKEVKGVGLGLSICYGLIKEHHGRIDVQSEVGRGTSFSIFLPLDANDPSAHDPGT